MLELVRKWAEVAELADALRSGRSGHYAREGSNPSSGTRRTNLFLRKEKTGLFYYSDTIIKCIQKYKIEYIKMLQIKKVE